MQATANRLAGPTGHRRGATPGAQPHVASMDDAALLGALPIAAAILTQDDAGAIRVQAHNDRFRDNVAQSSCTAMQWDDAECLKAGRSPIC
jgi:hypothetical protein